MQGPPATDRHFYISSRRCVRLVAIGVDSPGIGRRTMRRQTALGWRLRRRVMDTEGNRRLYGGDLFNAVLVISSIALVLLGVYTALSVFGLTPG
jgi:hypothetical protein